MTERERKRAFVEESLGTLLSVWGPRQGYERELSGPSYVPASYTSGDVATLADLLARMVGL